MFFKRFLFIAKKLTGYREKFTGKCFAQKWRDFFVMPVWFSDSLPRVLSPCFFFFFLCFPHQTDTPGVIMKESGRSRLYNWPWSLLVISIGTCQMLFLVIWYFEHLCRTCSVVWAFLPQGDWSMVVVCSKSAQKSLRIDPLDYGPAALVLLLQFSF